MSLRVWLPLTGTLENQGLSDLKFSIRNAEYTQTNNSGKIGVCYENTAHNNGGIVSDKMIDLGSKQSMCCWINMTDVYSSSSLMGIGGQHRFSTNTGMGLTIRYVSATTGYLSVNTGDGSSRTYNKYYGKTLMNTGKWYHVCYTYDGSDVKLYVDGELDATHTVGALSVPAEYVSVFLWSYNHNNYIFSGRINDFRCYDHVLSPAEVKEISKGLVLHYPLNRDGFGGDNLIVDTLKDSGESHTTYNIADYNFTESVVSGDTYTVSAKVNASSEKKGICFYHSGGSYQMGAWMPINDTGIYTATFTATDNMASRTAGAGHGYCRVYVSNNASTQGSTPLSGTANVEWIKVEKGSVATPWCPNPADSLYSEMGLDSMTEYDCSGYKYNATRVGTLSYSGDTPRYHVSTVFSGDNAVINCGHAFNVQGIENMSWTCWANCDEWSKGVYQYFVSAQEAGGFLLEVINSNNIVAIINAFHDAEHSTYGYHSAATTPEFDSGWHMLTGTYEPTALKLYIDGVLKKTLNFTTYGVHFNLKANMIIGGEAAGTGFSNPLSGKISDVRVYYTTLSADDVMDLYHKSASVASNGTILTYELEEA